MHPYRNPSQWPRFYGGRQRRSEAQRSLEKVKFRIESTTTRDRRTRFVGLKAPPLPTSVEASHRNARVGISLVSRPLMTNHNGQQLVSHYKTRIAPCRITANRSPAPLIDP